MKYYIEKTVDGDFDAVVEMTKEALAKEGFGVLSEIDIQEKLKEKLGTDFRKYKILGACNPPLAYEALKNEDKIGTMLPCSVIVQDWGQNRIEVAAVDPSASMMAVNNPGLIEVAKEVKGRLMKVIEGL
jgi:uncharacterized protein (DUF302 family)